MENLVVTLLVPREKYKDCPYPYAVQISYFDHQTQERRTTVRLIRLSGKRATWQLTRTYYRPEEWKAATVLDQAEYDLLMSGNPKPWYGSWSGYQSVYDYQGAGDRETNNGQLVWPEIEGLDIRWEAEREIRQRFQDEQNARNQAERDRRIAQWGEDL